MMANLRGAIRAIRGRCGTSSVSGTSYWHNPESCLVLSEIDHGPNPDIATDGTHIYLAKSQSLYSNEPWFDHSERDT